MAHLYVLSDLHIGPAGPLGSFFAGAELVAFLLSLDANDGILLFNGDLFDFLELPGRPHRLDLERAPGMVEEMLEKVAAHPWGPAAVRALRGFVEAGGRIVVLPGNHDLELYHPAAEGLLRRWIELAPTDDRLAVHRAAEPWRAQIGPWEVVAGHGHLADSWNRLATETIHRALERGVPAIDLPLGSRLVLETINAFKRACDPVTGEPRFPFVGLFQPAEPWTALLLLALDPPLALAHLPGAAGLGLRTLLRAVEHRLRSGPTFGPGTEPAAADLFADLAAALTAGLDPGEAAAPAAVVERLESALGGAPAPRAGYLSGGSASVQLWILGLARRAWEDGNSFFDLSRPGHYDRPILEEHLSTAAGPRVVLAGHTHAAREIRLDSDRVYLNTGTWTDLLPRPRAEEAADLRPWLQDLLAGRARRLRRLTYARVDASGAAIHVWPSSEAEAP
jgi:hypothetical protein